MLGCEYIMNPLERIAVYGSALAWSRKGKSREQLNDELSMRLHPKRRTRRRTPGAAPRHWQGHKTRLRGTKGPGADYTDSRMSPIRAAQGDMERVVIVRKAHTANPVFEKSCSMQTGGDQVPPRQAG